MTRKAGYSILALLLTIAWACQDSPTSPEHGSARPRPTVAKAVVPIDPPPDECDPYTDPNWCQDPCQQSITSGTPSSNYTTSGGCDGGGGSGGGIGGGGDPTTTDANPTLSAAEDEACRPEYGECTLVYDPGQWTAGEAALFADALSRLEQTCPDLHAVLQSKMNGHVAIWRESVYRYDVLVRGKWDWRGTGDIWIFSGATFRTVIHETVHAWLNDPHHPQAFQDKYNACR